MLRIVLTSHTCFCDDGFPVGQILCENMESAKKYAKENGISQPIYQKVQFTLDKNGIPILEIQKENNL